MNRYMARKFILVLILLAGAYFRLSHIELTSFSADQGRQLQITKDSLGNGDIILAGCSSHLGIRHGAILQYLLTYPMILSDRPEAGVFFLALLSLVAIYIVYRIGNDFFSWRVGIISAALFATSHISVTMARCLNNEPPLSPLFGALLIYALLKVINHKSSFYSFVLPILAAILILSHSSNLSVIIFLAAVILLYRKSIKIRHAVGGLLIGLIFLIPYFIYLLTSGFLEPNLLSGFIQAHLNLTGRHNPVIILKASATFFQIFTYNYPAHTAMWFDWLIMFLFLLGGAIFLHKVCLRNILIKEKPYLRIKESPNEVIILISIFTSLLIFVFIQARNPAYYMGQVPLLFILIAVAISFIIDKFKNRSLRYSLVFIFIILQATANLSNWKTLNIYGDSKLLKDKKAALDFILRDAGKQPFMISSSQDYIGDIEPHWLYLFKAMGGKPELARSIPDGTILYSINDNSHPQDDRLPVVRFGTTGIYKQKLHEGIKMALMQDLKYSFHKENNWELPDFDDSSWHSFLSAEGIPAKARIIYIRADLIVPDGFKYESIKGEINGYLLDAYLDGKKIKLSDSRFILNRGIAKGYLIKKLTRVIYEANAVDFLRAGSHNLSLRILIPGRSFYFDTQLEPGLLIFNLK